MSFPAYEEYKDSEVEWLGEVPSYWQVASLKRVVDPERQITYGIVQAGPNVNGGVPYIRPADMTDETGVVSENEMLRTSDEIADAYSRSMISAGDLVCSIGPSFGKVMVTPESLEGANLTQGTARVAVEPPNNPRYFFWVLRSLPSVSQWESSVGGATFRALNLGPLAATEVLLPPPNEQTAIASFLDTETSKIDGLVSEQRRLIELLKEKRQAVISHAVTKGLNPDVKMKDSGIEWLGDVPEHWDVKPMKSVSELFGRIGFRGYTTADLVDEGEGAITLSPSNMVEGTLALEKCTHISWDKYEESPEIMIRSGDVIMVKTGSTLGKVAYVGEVPHEMTINPQLVIFKNITCVSRFLFYVITTPSIQALVSVNNTGSSIPTMTQQAIGNFSFVLPPHSEQSAIVDFIDERMIEFNELLSQAERAIELLQERRTALISAAVTGKIDVRGYKPEESVA